MQINFNREINITNKVLIIDGTSGAGKSLINELVQGFQNVELPIWDTLYEHIACLYAYDQIVESSAKTIIANAAEERLYNLLIGRNTNFRFRDNSSIFNNPNKIKNFLRIFAQEGEPVLENITLNKNILCLGTHHLLSFPDLMIKTFEKNLRILEIIRHPATVINFWIQRRWGERLGVDIRDFTLWIKHKNHNVPWFACNNENTYLDLNKYEKIIYGLSWIIKARTRKLKTYEEFLKERLMIIPFEKLVSYPDPYITNLEVFLGKKKNNNLRKICKKLKLPRKLDSKEIETQKHNVYSLDISKKSKEIFEELCYDYESENKI